MRYRRIVVSVCSRRSNSSTAIPRLPTVTTPCGNHTWSHPGPAMKTVAAQSTQVRTPAAEPVDSCCDHSNTHVDTMRLVSALRRAAMGTSAPSIGPATPCSASAARTASSCRWWCSAGNHASTIGIVGGHRELDKGPLATVAPRDLPGRTFRPAIFGTTIGRRCLCAIASVLRYCCIL